MTQKTNYYFLSGFFLLAFFVVQYTGIYGNPGWFKAFLLILSATFLISGLAARTKK